MTVLVDSNVLIDVATNDTMWAEPSRRAILEIARHRELVINQIIFAEVSVSFARIEDVDERLPRAVFRREDLPWEAGFLAGKVFVEYRRRGGNKLAPLPDFFIGAHAAIRGYDLLTRDSRGFRGYFPTVTFISPESST